MYTDYRQPLMVKPAEAVTLSNKYGNISAIQFVYDIYKEFIKPERIAAMSNDRQWNDMLLLAACFEAGRMQGKREIRRHRA